MDYSLTTVTEPICEPVTPDLVKLHARIDLDVEDALIGEWIQAAREYAEDHTGRAWVTQTLKMIMCGFPHCSRNIELPVEPVSSVSSVKYYDQSGSLTTLVAGTDYQVWLDHSPPLIAPMPTKTWPYPQTNKLGSVEIVFVAGYGANSGWPARANQAIYTTLTYWNKNRGDGWDATVLGLPQGAIALLDSLWTGAY